ncbi:MAG TPA: NosD domain-containing protein, partial [Candidatus Thermoplasmatota archaeon]|nr:NosD domain-containing protein [Candidatus Thermoplasmatota archaeon]
MLLFSSLTFATNLLPRNDSFKSSTKQLTDEKDQQSDLFLSKNNGTVFYVGGSGPGNFSTIQNAIDNANDYDSIFVYNGVYNENIIIDKKISLIGEQQSSTIIEGNNFASTVTIEQDDSSIQFFTIRNGNYYGLFLDNTYRVIIKNNLIINNVNHGIFGYSIIDCVISNNEITTNENGIKLDYSCRGCIIKNNSIHDHSQNGIFLKSSYENIVEYNSFINNKYDIELNQCNDTEIFHNTIHNHGETGIQLKKSDQNNIKYNTITFENEGIEIWD